MSDAPVKADPAMFAPCPKPVSATAPEGQNAAMAEGVRMRDNPAEWAFVRLSKLIEEFEGQLDKDEEIGARIVGLPGDGTMQIEDVGFWGPDLILFLGKNADGKPVRLVQHYTQISVVLSALKKPEEREAHRIGFQLSEMVQKTNPKS
ncbi:MAG: hypothetical protein EON91_01260 [Brevundimonas sp.]|uniref:DUF6173 family protein n=1 Tax=Brevundimonas sp. TaxID=1871086 RepID=UPI0011F6AFF9|nr:DUF6173 family protein [Brevundimonas sp.]RZJ19511.1 MAG: hypothetical protein EON91_01260 [Brevundimonas sp.]